MTTRSHCCHNQRTTLEQLHGKLDRFFSPNDVQHLMKTYERSKRRNLVVLRCMYCHNQLNKVLYIHPHCQNTGAWKSGPINLCNGLLDLFWASSHSTPSLIPSPHACALRKLDYLDQNLVVGTSAGGTTGLWTCKHCLPSVMPCIQLHCCITFGWCLWGLSWCHNFGWFGLTGLSFLFAVAAAVTAGGRGGATAAAVAGSRVTAGAGLLAIAPFSLLLAAIVVVVVVCVLSLRRGSRNDFLDGMRLSGNRGLGGRLEWLPVLNSWPAALCWWPCYSHLSWVSGSLGQRLSRYRPAGIVVRGVYISSACKEHIRFDVD